MIAWSTSVLCRNGTYGRIKVSIRKADILARGRVMNGAVIRVDGAASERMGKLLEERGISAERLVLSARL